jgi:hypothetical protein
MDHNLELIKSRIARYEVMEEDSASGSSIATESAQSHSRTHNVINTNDSRSASSEDQYSQDSSEDAYKSANFKKRNTSGLSDSKEHNSPDKRSKSAVTLLPANTSKRAPLVEVIDEKDSDANSDRTLEDHLSPQIDLSDSLKV